MCLWLATGLSDVAERCVTCPTGEAGLRPRIVVWDAASMAVIAVTRCVCVCVRVCVCECALGGVHLPVCTRATSCCRYDYSRMSMCAHSGLHRRGVAFVDFSPDGSRIASCGLDDGHTVAIHAFAPAAPGAPRTRAAACARPPQLRAECICVCVCARGWVRISRVFFVSVRDESVGVVAGTNASLTLVGSMYMHRNKVLDCRWTSEDRCVRACGCAWLYVRGCARVCVFGLCACAALCCVLACPFMFVCMHVCWPAMRAVTFTRAPLLQRRVRWRPARVRA